MEQLLDENRVELTGRVVSEAEFSHKTYGEGFYIIKLGIERMSGYEDCVLLMVSERLLRTEGIIPGDMLTVSGQIRTYNQQTDGHNHLLIVVFVKAMEVINTAAEMENRVFLEGYICKETVRRSSPLGRELCDMMLAVNRMYNKSDYIPCISWGRNAVFGGELQIGDKICLEGRLQSRQYRKYDEEGRTVEKTAYEVSVTHMETCE